MTLKMMKRRYNRILKSVEIEMSINVTPSYHIFTQPKISKKESLSYTDNFDDFDDD